MDTIINLDGGHAILIEQSFWHTNFYFDSFPMSLCGKESAGWSTVYRFASVTREDLHKVTYSLLIVRTFFGFIKSIRVEKFYGDSMLQWYDEIGEVVYYR